VEEGLNGFVDQIADESNAVTAEQLVEFLTRVGHPALSMDPLI
jgi:CO dehydrogenase/acetyl-CoA synthase beta subunit